MFFPSTVLKGKASPKKIGMLRHKFLIPPFSILDARQGYWQQRKRAWIALGIKGELGRGDSLLYGTGGVSDPGLNPYREKEKRKHDGTLYQNQNRLCEIMADKPGKKKKPKRISGPGTCLNTPIHLFDGGTTEEETASMAGTSVFDPVLCEAVYTWFCPPGGHILDPFAGEATKGIVAAYLGYNYTGIELRREQIDVNVKQAEKIGVSPTWIEGDSHKIRGLLPRDAKYDFVWTSPPYYDLEIYSELEKDGSAFKTYEQFMAWYEDIFDQAVRRMKENRFLAVKVGEIRDKKTGVYRNFVGDNVNVFTRLGLKYFNELILVTVAGSLPIRIVSQFPTNRKIGKSHQNILVFYKGDISKIKEVFENA